MNDEELKSAVDKALDNFIVADQNFSGPTQARDAYIGSFA
jgi:hypothetical protein